MELSHAVLSTPYQIPFVTGFPITLQEPSDKDLFLPRKLLINVMGALVLKKYFHFYTLLFFFFYIAFTFTLKGCEAQDTTMNTAVVSTSKVTCQQLMSGMRSRRQLLLGNGYMVRKNPTNINTNNILCSAEGQSGTPHQSGLVLGVAQPKLSPTH